MAANDDDDDDGGGGGKCLVMAAKMENGINANDIIRQEHIKAHNQWTSQFLLRRNFCKIPPLFASGRHDTVGGAVGGLL